MSGHKIITEFWMKPGPERGADWMATFEDYDGAIDAHDPIGYGPTETAAVADLLQQEDERRASGR